MSKLMAAGLVLAILGVLGLAIPYFTTSETTEVAKLGDLKIETTENTSHSIPPVAALSVLILGMVLLGGGFYKKA